MRVKFTITFIILFVLTACKFSNLHLASDAKTGKYLGVVQYEIRDYESKEILYYEVGMETGSIRKSPQEIKIYEP